MPFHLMLFDDSIAGDYIKVYPYIWYQGFDSYILIIYCNFIVGKIMCI